MNAFKEDSGDTVLSHHTINLLGLAVGVRVRPRLMLMLMLCTPSMLTESAKTHMFWEKSKSYWLYFKVDRKSKTIHVFFNGILYNFLLQHHLFSYAYWSEGGATCPFHEIDQ